MIHERLMLSCSRFVARHETLQVSTLEDIHNELRSLNERLAFVEDLVEEVIVRQLPKAKISRRELAEIKKLVAEVRRGNRATLEELTSA